MPPATPSASSRARLLGRRELLNWLNRAAACEYADLTECSDGVAFCELLEAMHPGVVPLHRVHYAARREDARPHCHQPNAIDEVDMVTPTRRLHRERERGVDHPQRTRAQRACCTASPPL